MNRRNMLLQLSFLAILVLATNVLSQGIQWVTPSGGIIPPHSWVGAETINTSEKIYICQGRRQESVVCGQTSRNIRGGNCSITYDDNIWVVKNEMILTLPLWVPYTFKWVEGYTYGRVPPNSVECGDMAYVGRFVNGSDVILGKVDSLNQAFFYADKIDGKERYIKIGYEVLISEDMT